MPPKPQKKTRQAYSVILAAIERGEYDDARYLPSVASLAAKIGVSVAPVWRAIELLKKEGRLAGDPGCRTILASRPSKPSRVILDKQRPSAQRQSKSSALQVRIRSDILNGRLRHERSLPPEKDLSATYGVSRMTLRKTLRALTEQGVLSQLGSRYSPVSIVARPSVSQQHVVLLGPGSNMGANITYGYWRQESYKLLEQECAKAGMALDVVCFFRPGGGLKLNDELPRRLNYGTITDNRPDVAGYIYLVTGLDSREDDLLRTVAKTKRPVAIFDELGTWPMPSFLREFPNVRMFHNTISARPAQQVARYLLELGHRTAVYISPYHHLEYSRLRYDGLAREFAAVEGARIVAVTSADVPQQAPPPPEVGRGIDEMQRVAATWAGTLPSSFRGPMDRCFGMLGDATQEGMLRESVLLLCKRALKIEDATAWILVNDACAACALEFLEDKKIAVPGKISIISFDDLPIALTSGISSYNFNYPAVMIAMLGYITNPRLYPVSRQVIEIEGQIIPRRRTLGPCRQS